MAQVKYHGEFPEDQDTITHHGYEFEKGKAVEVKEKALVEKFKTNRFFEVSGESDKDQVAEGKDEAEQAEAETLREWLEGKSVPLRANASLKALREAKADYDKRAEEALKG